MLTGMKASKKKQPALLYAGCGRLLPFSQEGCDAHSHVMARVFGFTIWLKCISKVFFIFCRFLPLLGDLPDKYELSL